MSKPTKADAELLLRLYAIMRSDEDFKKATWWLYEELDVKSYRAFKKKYPMGSEGCRNFIVVANYWEVLGTLVNNGLVGLDLVFDMFAIPWEKVEPIVYGLRKDMKIPRLYENLEILAKKFPEWEKTHPPKI